MTARAERQPLVAVLAAGLAARFGGGKLDTDLDGRPLGQWVLDAVAAAGLGPGVIVVGPQAPDFAKAAQGWRLLVNPQPERGQGHSVALACREAQAQSRAVLLMLADMPLVSPEHLQHLVSSPATAATRYPGGRLGVPVGIAAADVGKFTALTGDRGAAPILARLDGLDAIGAPPGTLRDIDDAGSLEDVRRTLARRRD